MIMYTLNEHTNQLINSKNSFPQHSAERKIRKVLGNWLSLLTYIGGKDWRICATHLLKNPINP